MYAEVKVRNDNSILEWRTSNSWGINCELEKEDLEWITTYNAPEDFEDHPLWYSYDLVSGDYILNEDRKTEDIRNELITDLRQRRELECFSVVNRGEVWYKRLDALQKEELDAWYQAWLDVTITLTPPDPLPWI